MNLHELKSKIQQIHGTISDMVSHYKNEFSNNYLDIHFFLPNFELEILMRRIEYSIGLHQQDSAHILSGNLYSLLDNLDHHLDYITRSAFLAISEKSIRKDLYHSYQTMTQIIDHISEEAGLRRPISPIYGPPVMGSKSEPSLSRHQTFDLVEEDENNIENDNFAAENKIMSLNENLPENEEAINQILLEDLERQDRYELLDNNDIQDINFFGDFTDLPEYIISSYQFFSIFLVSN